MDFSFIIPVYNCEAYIEACAESILEMELPSFEIILVDDGSRDRSPELCDALSCQHAQIRVLHRKNGGASSARNAGLQIAKGTYILFVDSDDSLDSAALKDILSDSRVFHSDLTVFGLTFDYYHHSKCYRRDSLYFPEDRILTQDDWPGKMVELYEHNAVSPLWNKVFCREIITKNHLMLNESMFLYEDLEFVLRYLACCRDIWNVPKAAYHYRQTEDEGNAGRRLSRIDSIPQFLIPIENAMSALRTRHPDFSEADCERILQSLHLTLAREKIAVSPPDVVRTVCRDYASWEAERLHCPATSQFRDYLLNESVFMLLLRRTRTAIRHRIAVAVKSCLSQLRKGT